MYPHDILSVSTYEYNQHSFFHVFPPLPPPRGHYPQLFKSQLVVTRSLMTGSQVDHSTSNVIHIPGDIYLDMHLIW